MMDLAVLTMLPLLGLVPKGVKLIRPKKLLGEEETAIRRYLDASPPSLATSNAARHRPDWKNILVVVHTAN